MLDQRRSWADVVQMLYKCFVFAGKTNLFVPQPVSLYPLLFNSDMFDLGVVRIRNTRRQVNLPLITITLIFVK